MATAAEPGRVADEPSLGRVFNLAFATIADQPFTTFGLAFLAGAVPARLFDYAQHAVQPLIPDAVGTAGLMGIAFATMLVTFALSAVAQGALAVPVWCRAAKRRAGFAESLGAVLAMLGPVLLVGATVGLVGTIGIVALVVPGIVALCVWAVAVPIVVAERRGPFEALRRSAFLTRHARWKVLALLLVHGAITIAVSLAMRRVMLALAELPRLGQLQPGGLGVPLVPYLVHALVETVFGCLFGCLWSALYVELRDWKEGAPADELAQVFE